MTKRLFFSSLLFCCIAAGIVWKMSWLHPVEKIFESEGEENENPQQRAEAIAARFQYEFDILRDPATGKIPDDIYKKEMAQAMSIPLAGSFQTMTGNINRTLLGVNSPSTNVYYPAGPTNVGGRTRVFAFDRRYNGTTNKVMISGSVSGGIMRSIDGGQNWTLVTPDQQIHNLTSLAQDPRTDSANIWYAGTGEALGNSAGASGTAFYLGNGIFKSRDNGATWTALSSTQSTLETFNSPFDMVHRIVVNPVNGDVYAACQSVIERSQDGGATWKIVKGTFGGGTYNGFTDVAITNTGKVYIAFHLHSNVATDRGVWESPNGDVGSYTAIAGNAPDVPAGFKQNTSTSNWGRVMLQLAPSNNNILYVLYENGLSQSAATPVPEADLFKADFSTGVAVWTNLSANMPDMPGGNKSGTDPLALQGGYDMTIAVKPDDPNTLFIGGTNLYRSTNGFSSAATTAWIGGYTTDFTYSLYPGSHPDIHYLAFDPSNSKRAVCCNDGGIQITEDITVSSVSWSMFPNYQTLQYYGVALDPEIGKFNFEGGAQDNGTWFRDASLYFGARPSSRPGVNDFISLFGGDGVCVDIAKLNAAGNQQLTYFGAQSGTLVRDDIVHNDTYPGANIKPRVTDLTSNGSAGYGDFVTRFKLSNANPEILFYANYNKLFRTNAASTVDSTKWTRLTAVENAVNSTGGTSVSIRSMNFSWGAYQSSHAMYFGTNNGKLFRLDDYANADATTVPKDISPAAFGSGWNVADIAVNPNDDNEIMAVVSNYGTIGIWWTPNAKSATPTWSNVEGNLSLPSIRSCAIVVKKDASNNPVTEYYVGTSVGLYSTASISATIAALGTVQWSREAASLINFAVVSCMDYRPEDNTLLIGTHGNGMYYTVIGSANFQPGTVTAIAPIVNDPSFVKIFPTVSNGNYQYSTGSMTGIHSMEIRVFNMQGQPVFQKKVGFSNGTISLPQLASGTYVVQILSDNKKYQGLQKIIKH